MKSIAAPEAAAAPHYPALDGLRGLAILLVVLYHYFDSNPLFRFGWMGVDLFFVLSGFLITQNLLRTRQHPRYFRNFYARRILRTFPLYFLLLATFFIGGSFLFRQQGPGSSFGWHLQHLLQFYTLTLNWVPLQAATADSPYLLHLWSLALEEQFYLVWPIILWLCPNETILKRLILCTCCCVLVFRCIISINHPEDYSRYYHSTLTRADSLLAGGFMAIVGTQQNAKFSKLLLYILLAWLLTLAATIYSFGNIHPDNWIMGSWGYTLTAICCALLIQYVITYEHTPSTSFIMLTFSKLGKISYSIYLLHLPVLFLLGRILANHPGVSHNVIAGVSLLTVFILSAISFRWIEQPFLALKKHFR